MSFPDYCIKRVEGVDSSTEPTCKSLLCFCIDRAFLFCSASVLSVNFELVLLPNPKLELGIFPRPRNDPEVYICGLVNKRRVKIAEYLPTLLTCL